MESASPLVLGDVKDTDIVHIAPSHSGTLLSHLLLLPRGWQPHIRKGGVEARCPARFLRPHTVPGSSLTFPSVGSGMVADANHQPALWLAFMGTNTQSLHSLYCSPSLSSLLCSILLVEQTWQVDIICRNYASWLTQSSWIKFMKKNKNPIPFYTYSLSLTSMFFCFSVTVLPHTYTTHAGLKSAKTDCKCDASAYQLPSRHLWHLVARIWIWPASCCCGPCVYLCSISYIRRQFLLTPSGFAAVKVALLTASLLFSFFLYDFKSQRIPHMTEEERSFCELKRTFRCCFFLGLYCSITYTLSLPQSIHIMRSISGWRH